jgi:beta-lactamase class D
MTNPSVPVFSAVILLMSVLPSIAKADCSLLTDAATGSVLSRSGDCDTPVTPASSFKIPLAVMGYDAGILTDADHPAWEFQEGYADWMENWKTTVTPRYWLDKSVVWYSQELTKKLGRAKFQTYVDAFDYGNRDLTGDPGQDNGLTHAWLGSSLKISPVEQAQFLDKLINRKLGVSDQAYQFTEDAIQKTTLSNGWVVSGKTGTSPRSNSDGSPDAQNRQLGWYVGWAEKDARKIIFVHLLVDETKQEGFAGPRAKKALLKVLPAELDKL